MPPETKNSNQITLGNASHVNINIGDGNTQNLNSSPSNPIPETNKPIFAVPIAQNPYFTARKKELADIKKYIAKQPVGLGGVGKVIRRRISRISMRNSITLCCGLWQIRG